MIFHKDGSVLLDVKEEDIKEQVKVLDIKEQVKVLLELLCFLLGDHAIAILIQRRQGKRKVLGKGMLTKKDQADGGELHGNLGLVGLEREKGGRME